MPIRLATPEDAQVLTTLAIQFRNHLAREAPTDTQFLDSIALLLALPDTEFLLATLDAAPVGYVLLRYRHSMWAAGQEATLEDLFVDPGARRHGLGKELVRFALGRAEARGCATVCLDTNENNTGSLRIYTQLGFETLSRRWQGRQLFLRRNAPVSAPASAYARPLPAGPFGGRYGRRNSPAGPG